MAKIGGGTWDLVAADDPSDWKEEFSFLKSLDAGLRCDLCFDIFTAPVSIKDCNHTFCSACVRNAINKPGEEMSGRCPKCMNKNVYDSSLLPQPALENVALQWRNARSQLYNMQQARLQEQAARASSSSNKQMNGKRARDEADLSSSPSSPHLRRSKRSNSARKAGTPSYAEHVIIDDSSQDEFEDIQSSDPESKTPDQHLNNPETQQNISDTKDYRQIGASDVVQCPLCQHTFTYRALNIHLDKGTCSPDDPEPSPQERGLTAPKIGSTASSWLASSGRSNVLASPSPATSTNRSTGGSSNGIVKEDRRKKLVRPTYDILKTNDIKKLLRDWQLNCAGTDRKRMVERHRKWINLYNANLDASEQVRKSNVSLRQELEQWERAQDEVGSGLSEKRAKTWAMDHKTDFAALARLARETHMRDRSKHLEEKKAEQAVASDGQQPVSVTSDPSITAISHEGILQENKESK